jgi:RNA polymerase sigma-70 factor (ECF subfamily)
MGLLFANDTGFFENLYDKCNREIYMICFSYCHNKADAEDCLQEVFYRAMSKPSEVKRHPAPDKWLFITARLVSLEKLRANNTACRHELNIDDFETVLESGAFEDDLLERQYTEMDIVLLRNDILEKLNTKERELYILRYVDKLSVDIIAERLKICYSNATTRLNRLKTKILNLVEKIFCD